MRITLLGTGSADGWPNPFCDCGSCTAERVAGRSRQPSSALVDGVVLVDCGPTTPHAATAAGVSLRGVEHVLVTHGHPDHLDPAFLLSRGWVPAEHVLHVWGPAGAIELCRPWIRPGAPVELHVLAPGETVTLPTVLGTYTVTVVAAEHSSGNGDALSAEAVLYSVESPDHRRLLYATDTAHLPASTIALLATPLDVLLVDETFGDTDDHGTGHLDLSTLPVLLESLRESGAITDDTLIIATHLSHHNPPTPALRARLSPLGVTVMDDRSVIDTESPAAPRVHLILGGARSGKSHYAESLAASADKVTYVATGGSRPDDPEWRERVRIHRDRRPAAWTTVETLDVAGVVATASPGSTILVDCLALWLTGQLDLLDAWARLEQGDRAGIVADIGELVDALLAALATSRAHVLLVSNEVGLGVVPETPSGRLFRDLLGVVNARVASACHRTTVVIAGRPLALGGTSGPGGLT